LPNNAALKTSLEDSQMSYKKTCSLCLSLTYSMSKYETQISTNHKLRFIADEIVQPQQEIN